VRLVSIVSKPSAFGQLADKKDEGQMAKTSPGEFVRQVRAEMTKVTWPTRKETMITTVMVLIMTAILSVFFLGVDQLFGRAVKFLLSLASGA